MPIFPRGSDVLWGSVKMGLSLEALDRQVSRTRLVLILIGAVGLLFGTLGATVLAGRITRPIKKLADGTVRIARGEFSHRIEIHSRDEIGRLARDFNDMSEKLRQTLEAIEVANRKLVQSEKLAQIGRMAATIAHEIRNPLTSVKLNIQKVRSSLHLDEIEQEHMSLSEEGIAQIERFIKELLNFTRVSDLQKARFGIEQVLDESVKLLRDVLAEKSIAVERRYAAGLPGRRGTSSCGAPTRARCSWRSRWRSTGGGRGGGAAPAPSAARGGSAPRRCRSRRHVPPHLLRLARLPREIRRADWQPRLGAGRPASNPARRPSSTYGLPLLAYTAPLLVVHAVEAWKDDLAAVLSLPVAVRYSVYAAMIYLTVLFGDFAGAQFIYFQF